MKNLKQLTLHFIERDDTYNLRLGGSGGISEYSFKNIGKVTVKDKSGNTFRVNVDDERYLTGELTHISRDTVVVRDTNGRTFRVDVDDERYLNGEFVSINKDKITVKDSKGNYFRVDINDERYKSGELTPLHNGISLPKVKCPYCGDIGDILNMKLNHFEYCNSNPNKKSKPKRVTNEYTCPHCGLDGNGPSMGRWHFDNCKHNPNSTDKRFKYDKVICPHCGTSGRGPNMKRYHFNNCKHINTQ